MKPAPCPFCGEDKRIESDGYVMACLRCEASGPLVSFGRPMSETERWNQRPALAAGTRSDETNEDSAQSEGCQSGPKGNAQ